MDADESFVSVLAMQAASAIRRESLLAQNLSGQEFLHSVISSATDAIVVTDRQGRITLFNAGAEKMLGLREQEVLGRPVPEFYHDTGNILWRIRRALRNGNSHLSFETSLRAADGREVPVQLNLNWLRDTSGRITGILGVAKDFTELKKLEAARLEAERLSGLERMAVTVSDRINTPLSVIMAHLELVRLTQKNLGRETDNSLREIEAQVFHIKHILDQLNSQKNARIKEYGLPNVDMYDLDLKEDEPPRKAKEARDAGKSAPAGKGRSGSKGARRGKASGPSKLKRSGGNRRAQTAGASNAREEP